MFSIKSYETENLHQREKNCLQKNATEHRKHEKMEKFALKSEKIAIVASTCLKRF